MTEVDLDDADEATLQRELLKMDVKLRYRQLWWEHPKNAAIVLGVVIALAGVLGWKIGATPPAPIVIQLQQPAR